MPYGGTTKKQDKKIESCVNTLLASKDFKPSLKQFGNKTKKQAAIRICKAKIMK